MMILIASGCLAWQHRRTGVVAGMTAKTVPSSESTHGKFHGGNMGKKGSNLVKHHCL
jgi:hypothetical protein